LWIYDILLYLRSGWHRQWYSVHHFDDETSSSTTIRINHFSMGDSGNVLSIRAEAKCESKPLWNIIRSLNHVLRKIPKYEREFCWSEREYSLVDDDIRLMDWCPFGVFIMQNRCTLLSGRVG
jgi:hypothetical protein